MNSYPAQPHYLVALALAGTLATLASAGCDGSSSTNSKGGGATGNSGTSGTGATSNGGSSSGAGPAGGTSGSSNGGSSGTDAIGGGAGEAGGDSGGTASGGTAGTARGGMAGASGVGGSAGAGIGGMGGSGGAAGNVGTLGEPCSPRGGLACAGNHQKLTVLCGADDTWQPNQTCGADQFCDSTPGPNVGTCQPALPECVDGPGTAWCEEDDKHLVTCGADAVTTTRAACPRACHDGRCRDDVSECPVWADYDLGFACSGDCGSADPCDVTLGGCPVARITPNGVGDFRALVRATWADDACVSEDGQCGEMAIGVGDMDVYIRVTATPPWRLGNCLQTHTQCQVFHLTDPLSFAISAPIESGPANIIVEEFDAEPSCP